MGAAVRSGARSALGPQRRGVRRRSVLYRHDGNGVHQGPSGRRSEVLAAAALLKHFLANSNENHRNSSTSDFDERLFQEYYAVPFRMAFTEGGAQAVMASYNAWNGTPMGVNPVLAEYCPRKWGVDMISSDGGAVKLVAVERTLPRPEGSGRRGPQGRHQPVPRRYADETERSAEGRNDHRGRDRRGAAAANSA